MAKDTYKNAEVGAANNWSGMAIDREREIIYVPTGSGAFDFYREKAMWRLRYRKNTMYISLMN
jgi:glucose dehydrogenase